ncbi:atp-binding protein [Diplodia corticola]|uniref:Atp-binding protein n=1 Tax=Diplodia corticola TaxID=236234 RepID=A0A1J9QPE0_9PEZI|nr:atp-binding protein [Diplodia corticola]OJD30321.1 atp-binding protein [Diplodia corticola]
MLHDVTLQRGSTTRKDDAAMKSRVFSTLRALQHENPLGLPRSGAPPQIPRMQRGLPQKRSIKDVNKVVAVSSAKGGVGKSTIAVNLALSFARRGLRAGILDTDIFGPSIPTLLNLSGEPRLSPNNQLLPLSNYGIKSMSMGYLVGEDSPIVWRGLMVMKALQQLLHEVDWGGLDVLVLDLPPGTGDVQLTITQQVVVDGAVVVSTPQDIALKDAIKGVHMFRKTAVPLLGVVENMAAFHCPHCHVETPIFASTSASASAQSSSDDVATAHAHSLHARFEALGVPLLGRIPLHPRICADADRGKPSVVAEPAESPNVVAFEAVARGVAERIGLKW